MPPICRSRLVVMLSGSGTTLQNLFDQQKRGDLPAETVLVLSDQRKAYGLERAKLAGVPAMVLSPKSFPSEQAYKEQLVQHWRAVAADFIILAGYLKKVPIDEDWIGKVINIHPALLPKFGGPGMYGLKVHRMVIQSGERLSGCTVHFVDAEYDHGPIIEQSIVNVCEDDDESSLQHKVQEAERKLYPKVISDLIRGRIKLENGQVVRRG